jgi:hypothetical protein
MALFISLFNKGPTIIIDQKTQSHYTTHSGSKSHRGNTARFSFELSWFEQEGFDELVATEWAAGPIGKMPIETWQNKIRHLRKFLRGWEKNISGKYKKEK